MTAIEYREVTLDEPGECWAVRDGQRETHDRRECEHFLPPVPPACVCDDPQAAHDAGAGVCGICDCNAYRPGHKPEESGH